MKRHIGHKDALRCGPVLVRFSTFNGCAGEPLLHIAIANDGRRAERLVGESRLARWISRRLLVRDLAKQYRQELKLSLKAYEVSLSHEKRGKP